MWICGLFLVVLVALVTGLSFLSKADFLQIHSVEIGNTETVSADTVHQIAINNLSGNWWYLFSKNNLFLYPKKAIEEAVKAQFPTVASVAFGHDGLQTLRIVITERKPASLACGTISKNISENATTTTCFYMDDTGFIYAPAPEFSSGVYLRYSLGVTASTSDLFASSPLSVGQYISDSSRFADVHTATAFLSDMGLHVTAVRILSGGDYALTFDNTSTTASSTPGGEATLLFNVSTTSQPLSTTLEYFNQFWLHERWPAFDYIDLRFGKDIVYKLK